MSNPTFLILTRNGVADPGQEATLAALEARLRQPGAKLLVHLHGGLVDEATGKAAAARLSSVGQNSWNLGDDWTQLYLIWRTGVFETIRANWIELAHDDRLYQVVLTKLIRFVARKIGIPVPGGSRSADEAFNLSEEEVRKRIIGLGTPAQRRDPFVDIETHFNIDAPEGTRATVMGAQTETALALEFQSELASSREFQLALADIDNAANDGLPGRAMLSPGDMEKGLKMMRRLSSEVQAEIGPIETLSDRTARGPVSVGTFLLKHAGQIAWRCFKRFRSNRDHGFHATIVEELCRELYGDLVGAKIWGMMVKDAADHFTGQGFGNALLDMLGRVSQPEHFVVTGHSAGSIWASHMLLRMSSVGLERRVKLFLLAPAVRQDLFSEVLDRADTLLETCHMFTMTDGLECKDAVLGHDKGYIYPRSLLYCVSGVFEEHAAKAYADAPLLGMRRFAGAPWLTDSEKQNESLISRFFERAPNGIVLSSTEGVCEADCHGCFDNEPKTLASVAALF